MFETAEICMPIYLHKTSQKLKEEKGNKILNCTKCAFRYNKQTTYSIFFKNLTILRMRIQRLRS